MLKHDDCRVRDSRFTREDKRWHICLLQAEKSAGCETGILTDPEPLHVDGSGRLRISHRQSSTPREQPFSLLIGICTP